MTPLIASKLFKRRCRTNNPKFKFSCTNLFLTLAANPPYCVQAFTKYIYTCINNCAIISFCTYTINLTVCRLPAAVPSLLCAAAGLSLLSTMSVHCSPLFHVTSNYCTFLLFGGKMLMRQSLKKKKRGDGGVPDLAELQMFTAGTAARSENSCCDMGLSRVRDVKKLSVDAKGPNWSPSVSCNIIESLIAGAYRCGNIPGHPPKTSERAVVRRIKAHH